MKIKLYGSLWVGVESDLGGSKGGLQLYRREVTFVWRVREQKESVSLERAQLAEGTACTKAQRHVTETVSHPFGLL